MYCKVFLCVIKYRVTESPSNLFINKNDDPENRLANIFKLYDFIIVRPDLYVYGGSKKDNLSEMIESLEKNFSLFT